MQITVAEDPDADFYFIAYRVRQSSLWLIAAVFAGIVLIVGRLP